MKKPIETKRYFDTFDSMRFLAFFCVYLGHLPSLNIPFFDTFQHSSGLGVKFFFTLSGFLITYLILDEKEKNGKLNLVHFFVRRILKIWPLYYLMILFAYCTPYIINMLGLSSSSLGYEPNWFLSVAFLENYKMIIENQLPNVSPLGVMWSLCIEEHFYIIWGIIFYYIKIEKTPYLIVVCIVVSWIAKFIYLQNGWNTIDIFTNFDTFAYGAIPAFLLVKRKDNFEKSIISLPYFLKMGIILFTILAVVFVHYLKEVIYINEILFSNFFCILFSIVIAFVVPGKNDIKIGKTNILSRLGKYTYGLYLYHTIVINLFIQIYTGNSLSLNSFSSSVLLFLLTLFVTVLVSILSYYLFEVRFLRLKISFRP